MKFAQITAVTVLTLLLSLSTIAIVTTAQEDLNVDEFGVGDTQEIADPALKLTLTVDPVQEYPSKRVRVILYIDSLIDSDRVSVSWRYDGGLYRLVGPIEDVLSVRAGQRTEFVKEFELNELAANGALVKVGEIGSRVNAFVGDVNYLSQTKTTMTFNQNLELTPISGQYQQAKTISTIIRWSLLILCSTSVIVVILLAVKRFRDYINTPDPET